MKQKSRSSSKLSDARLKSLLKGLREDVAAPPGFSARVLASLRAEGLLAEKPGSAPEAPSWLERVRAAFSAPGWGIAVPAALALAVVAGVYRAPSMFRKAPVPAPAVSVNGPSAAPAQAPVLAAARPARERAVLAQAGPGSRPAGSAVRKTVSMETVVASAPLGAGSAAAGPAGGSTAVSSSSPAAGLGSAAPQTTAAQAAPALVASSSSPLGAPSGGSAGGGYGAGSASPLDKAGPTATPTPQPVTPVPSLSQNSQVRNNVILASRGQNAQILFKVAEPGQVLVAIYSRLGVRVAVLQNGPLGPGQYDLSWDGQAGFGGLAASGIYEVVIQTPTYTDLHKMMLVK